VKNFYQYTLRAQTFNAYSLSAVVSRLLNCTMQACYILGLSLETSCIGADDWATRMASGL